MEKRHINRVNTLRPHRANTPPPRQPFRPGWFEVTIRLLRSEIEYDVDFETYQVSGVSGADAKGRFFLETSEKTADWMMRQVDSAIEDIEAALAAYSPRVSSRATTDEVPDNREWVINLMMEPGWRGDSKTMASLAHRFVVNYVLRAWYRMMDPNRYPLYDAEAEREKEKLVNVARSCDIKDVRFIL